jgi:hypothetical protein
VGEHPPEAACGLGGHLLGALLGTGDDEYVPSFIFQRKGLTKTAAEPTNLHPHLFTSVSPRCLHAYALSRAGATKIISLLSDPWVAYQAPVDVTIPTLAAAGRIVPYSVEPPLVIQSKSSPSDIQPGVGSPWRGLLADSTVERIWRDEGLVVPPLEWQEAIKDPSVTRPRVAGKAY